MNKNTHQLNRLLQAAAKISAVQPEPLSYRTEERVIASWKAATREEEERWDAKFYTPALAAALALVMVSLVFTYMEPAVTNVSDVEWSLMAVHNLCAL